MPGSRLPTMLKALIYNQLFGNAADSATTVLLHSGFYIFCMKIILHTFAIELSRVTFPKLLSLC